MAEQPVDAVTMFNRTLGRRPIKQIDGSVRPSDVLGNGYDTAYTFKGSAYVPVLYVPLDDGRHFFRVATPWEMYHSRLCFTSLSVRAKPGPAEPVIDANILVIGHRGLFDGEEVFVRYPDLRTQGVYDIDDLLDRGIDVIADGRQFQREWYFSQGYKQFAKPEVTLDLVTDSTGKVSHEMAEYTGGSIEFSAVQPADLIAIPAAIAGIAAGATRGVMWLIARRAATRAAARGAARELGEVVVNGFRRTGSLSGEDMVAHIREVVANRPELGHLMGQGVALDGDPLQARILESLEQWQKVHTRNVRWVNDGVVQLSSVPPRPRNLLTLMENGDLWIENQVSNGTRNISVYIRPGDHVVEQIEESTARFFFRQVTHELGADALAGRGGNIGHLLAYFNNRSSLQILEEAVRTGNVEQAVYGAGNVPR